MIAVFFFFMALWMTRAYFGAGFPYTHDGENHLARFMNFAAAVREGQWPPRFAPYLFSGFGFPVFHYNYPLANILSTPIIWLGFSPQKAFAFLVFSSAGVSITSWWILLRRSYSRTASFLSSLFLLASTYWANATFFRGNIGEILWFAILPLSILLWSKLNDSGWKFRWMVLIILVLMAGWLAHNVLAVMIMPILALWSLSLVWSKRKFMQWFGTWAASVGLVAWFWFPAVLELSLVALTGDNLVTEARSHALSWQQLWFSPLRFGFSRPAQLDTLGFGLGWLSFFTVWIGLGLGVQFLILLIQYKKKIQWNHRARTVLLVFLVGIGSILLSLQVSDWVWSAVPMLSIVQFPWRWLFLSTFVIAFVLAWILDRVSVLRSVVTVLLVFQIVALQQLKPVDIRNYASDHYLLYPHTTGTRNENRPETLKADTLGDWVPGPVIFEGDATIRTHRWLGSRREYEITANSDLVVQETTVYFPGWITRVDNQKVEYTLDLVEPFGFIAYRLPARPDEPYLIRTSFVERTPIRYWSEMTSAAVVIGLILTAIWKVRKNEW